MPKFWGLANNPMTFYQINCRQVPAAGTCPNLLVELTTIFKFFHYFYKRNISHDNKYDH